MRKITIAASTGSGPTAVAAFDAALQGAGVADYNLITLSSVIPPHSEIVREKRDRSEEEYGNRLYVVMARQDEHCLGRSAWAGVGWTQDAQDGAGLFVELHGGSRHEVEEAIRLSLRSMVARRRRAYGPVQYELSGIECTGDPVCALVIAVYKSVGWGAV